MGVSRRFFNQSLFCVWSKLFLIRGQRAAVRAGTKFRPIRGGQAASASSRLVGFINQLSWLPLIKGAVTALAVTEGLILSACLVSSPAYAADPATISLSPSSDNLTINVPTDGGIATASHSLHITTNDQVQDYTVTLESSGSSNTLASTNPKAPTINSIAGTNKLLTDNTWGYTLGTESTIDPNKATAIWNEVSLSNSTNKATIDSGTKLTQAVDKDIDVTYGVNIPKPVHGTYTANVTYTATAAPKPQSDYNQSKDGNILVEWDKNMIPIVYTGDNTTAKWQSITNTEARSNKVTSAGSKATQWYSYSGKQWANAVTVKADKLSKYQDKVAEVDNNDVLGYWVYIPRYKYKIQTDDKTVNTPPQDFEITFQTADEFNEKTDWPAKDATVKKGAVYTHPAFRWCSTVDKNGNKSNCKELKGFWMGKFETTGTGTNPTVKPNQQANTYDPIGELFTRNKSMGKPDNGNIGGATVSDITINGHNLAKMNSYLLKNSQWGAVAYLSASAYGAGKGNVQINAANGNGNDSNRDADNAPAWYGGVTGCGPKASGNQEGYHSGVNFGSSTVESLNACNGHEYNTTTGVLASTTNNIYGVYDMSGGAEEYVAGSYMDKVGQSSTEEIGTVAKPPYVDLYTDLQYDNQCGWIMYGGSAMCETYGWYGSETFYELASKPWLLRGGDAHNVSASAGVFASDNLPGYSEWDNISSRAVLVAAPK